MESLNLLHPILQVIAFTLYIIFVLPVAVFMCAKLGREGWLAANGKNSNSNNPHNHGQA